MDGFWKRAEYCWNKNRVLSWILVLVGIGLTLWVGFFPKSPGVSIGLLASVAGVMSVRPKMHPAEKFAWVAVLIAFTILEVHAIRVSDAKNEGTLNEQNQVFKGIADGLKTSMETSKGQYDSTISHVDGVLKTTQNVARLSKEDLEDVTGGERIVAMEIGEINGDVGVPFVFAPKPGIVRDVQIRVVNLALFEQDIKNPPIWGGTFPHDMFFSVGDLGAAQGKNLQPPIVLGPGDSVRFNIFFTGLNGFWNENLWMRKKNGQWYEAFRVFRKYTKLTNQTSRDVVFEQIGKGFLNSNEKIDWAEPKPQ
jgi:hypothetical protein